jgi:hypothetical protein
MRELQAAARVLHIFVAKAAAAAGTEWQPSAQLLGACCDALDPLLGAFKLVSGHERLHPASCAWCPPPHLHGDPVDCAVRISAFFALQGCRCCGSSSFTPPSRCRCKSHSKRCWTWR